MSKLKRILNIIFEEEKTELDILRENKKEKKVINTKDGFKPPTGDFPNIQIKTKSEDKLLSVTELSKYFKISAVELNKIFIELEWAKRENRWIIMTDLGEYHGAKKCYDPKSKTQFLKWNESVKKNLLLSKKIEEFKTSKTKKKSNKEKGEVYEAFIAKYYKDLGYTVWEHGKEKGRLDGGIDLITKKDKEIIFIQCKNWNARNRFKIDHIRVKASRAEARKFMIDNPLFKGYKMKFRYTLSNNCMHPSAIKYIEETNGLFDYEIIEIE